MKPSEAKKWLRAYALRKRRLPKKYQIQKSRRIISRFVHSACYKKAKVLAVYLGFGSEVLTDSLVRRAWADKKTILIPDTRKGLHNPCFFEYVKGERLQKTKFGPFELKKSKKVFPWKKIQVVVVPGLAFDESGHRLGYGGGTYDRILSKTAQATHIGFFFALQNLPRLPNEGHDHSMDLVVTDREIIDFH